jgi:hypothetical protein
LQEEKVRDFFAPAVCKKKKFMIFLLPQFAGRKNAVMLSCPIYSIFAANETLRQP